MKIAFSCSLAAGFLGALGLAAPASAQGPLAPPGVPAPTYQTLQQIFDAITALPAATRIPVNAANAPGDATAVHLISAPGSYYLVGSPAAVSGRALVKITASNVSLDLDGHVLDGAGVATAGILVSGAPSGLRVRNGFVVNVNGPGINAASATATAFEDLVISGVSGAGLRSGVPGLAARIVVTSAAGNGIFFASTAGSVARDCIVIGLSANGVTGILAGEVSACVVQGLDGGSGAANGIEAATGADCAVGGLTVGGSGTAAVGIAAGSVTNCHLLTMNGASSSTRPVIGIDAATVTGVHVEGVSSAVAAGNTSRGIRAGTVSASRVVGCEAFSNGNFYGIDASVAVGCHASEITSGAAALLAGIRGQRLVECYAGLVFSEAATASNGFLATDGAVIERNVSVGAATSAFRVASAIQPGVFAENVAASFGSSANATGAAGYSIDGTGNRVEANVAVSGGNTAYGIRVNGTQNYLRLNQVSGTTFNGTLTGAGGVNGLSYSIAAGNRYGSVTGPATPIASSTHVHANFQQQP